MANGFQSVQDPFGLGRLAQQIRLNRQEAAEAPIRAAQTELLQGKVQQQRLGLADLARQRQDQEDLRRSIEQSPDQDADFTTLQFLQKRNPQKAQQFMQNIFSNVGQIAKFNPAEAVNMLNRKTGSNIKYAGREGKLLKLDLGDKLTLYDQSTDSIVKSFPKARSGETIETLPDGSVKITRGPVTKKFTEVQLKSGGFADRVSNVLPIFERLEDDPQFDPADIGEAVASSIPGVGNILVSPKKQEYEQAKQDFITAVLRLESGAAISASEFEKEDRKYFPRPGDSPGVIRQKNEARKRQLDILKAGSAGAFDEIQTQRKQREAEEAKPQEQPVTATNKETGETLTLVNGKWVKQ